MLKIVNRLYGLLPVFVQNFGISLYGWKWHKRRFGGIYQEEFTGFKTRESCMHVHDILISTTLNESFGVAVIEAAACDLLTVSNNVGELLYLWSNDKNILLCINNAIAFSQAIVCLMEDNEKYREIV